METNCEICPYDLNYKGIPQYDKNKGKFVCDYLATGYINLLKTELKKILDSSSKNIANVEVFVHDQPKFYIPTAGQFATLSIQLELQWQKHIQQSLKYPNHQLKI